MLVRHATFCGRQRRVVLSSPESVGPNGKITLVKCFAGLAPPCSTYVRVHREDSQAALIFNAAAPDSAHLFHTLHAAHGVLCGCGYVSWPDYNLPHETNAYVSAQYLPLTPSSSCSNSNRVRSSESYRNSCQSCGPLKLN